jgi:hypothetical protein
MTNNPTNLGASMFFTLETTNMFVALDPNVNLSLKKREERYVIIAISQKPTVQFHTPHVSARIKLLQVEKYEM